MNPETWWNRLVRRLRGCSHNTLIANRIGSYFAQNLGTRMFSASCPDCGEIFSVYIPATADEHERLLERFPEAR